MSAGDWDIFGDLSELRRDIDLFARSVRLGRLVDQRDDVWAPPVDIFEGHDALVLLVDLPGVNRDEINLRVDQGSLTIEGQRTGTEAGPDVQLERPVGRFRRAFKLGVMVDPTGVQAVYRDGVLRITIPRSARAEAAWLQVDVE